VAPWPERYTARTLSNVFLDRWRGRDAELGANEAAKADYRAAADRGDRSVIPVWAGEAIDLITDLTPAVDVVTRIAGEAEEAPLHVGANLSRRTAHRRQPRRDTPGVTRPARWAHSP
jgi:nitronate monooxygenase